MSRREKERNRTMSFTWKNVNGVETLYWGTLPYGERGKDGSLILYYTPAGGPDGGWAKLKDAGILKSGDHVVIGSSHYIYGGGYNPGSPATETGEKITDKFQLAWEEAQRKNEELYAAQLKENAELRERLMGTISQTGAQADLDTIQQYNELLAQSRQAQVDAGRYNTTIRDTADMGIESQKMQQLARNKWDREQLQANYDMQISEQLQNIMQGLQIDYPDLALMYQAMLGYGSSGAASGGSTAPAGVGTNLVAATAEMGTDTTAPATAGSQVRTYPVVNVPRSITAKRYSYAPVGRIARKKTRQYGVYV